MTALSPHVFLNSFADSLIASFGHFQLIIMIGKAKNVDIDHTAHSNHTTILHIQLSSPNLCSIIFSNVATVALIIDH